LAAGGYSIGAIRREGGRQLFIESGESGQLNAIPH